MPKNNITNVGFIGLGAMGEPMAANLLRSGFQLIVFNRTADKCARLVDAGARQADSLANLAGNCDVVVIMVSDDLAATQLIVGDGGLIHHLSPHTLIVNASTVLPETSMALAGDLLERQIAYLDAPVSGSTAAAEAGKLFFMVGGEAHDYARATPLFEAAGRGHQHLGPVGCGNIAKLATNMLGLIHLAALGEAMTMVERAGVDLHRFYDIVNQSGARSVISDIKAEKMMARDRSCDFSLQLALKDLTLAQRMFNDPAAATPLLDAASDCYKLADAAGFGRDDVSAVHAWFEQQAQIQS